ncbi:MAG: hypothetical protein ACOYT8_06800 [Candidatus Dependentiae bacterium]
MNEIKWATVQNVRDRYSWDLANDDKLSTLALLFSEGFSFLEDNKKKLIEEKETTGGGGNLLHLYITNNLAYLEPRYWGDDNLEEDEPNTCQIIIPRNVLLAIIDESMKWMKKEVDRVVFMHYKNHYFVADRVLTEDELNAILRDSQNQEIVAIKDN